MRSLFLAVAALSACSSIRAAPSSPQRVFQHDISQDESFTVFKHEDFPTHEIRAIQPMGFCDSTVQQWSGYLDTPNNRHMYFWWVWRFETRFCYKADELALIFRFFESRSDPVNDPVVLWLNGGKARADDFQAGHNNRY